MSTNALLARIDRVEAASWRSGLQDLARHAPDAPPETLTFEKGGCTAFATPSTRIPMFNRVLAFTARVLEHLGEILAFYDDLGIPPRLDVCPGAATKEAVAALTDHGLIRAEHASYVRRLWRHPSEIAVGTPSVGVEVRPLAADERDAWLSIDEAVWPGSRGDRRAKLEATVDAPRFHRFLAHVDGEAVALGRLEVIDGIAVLNGAGTLPAHRGKGCQRALTSARVRVARELGCDAVTSLVSPGSQSEKNLCRAGLTRASDRIVWTRPEYERHPFFADV